MTLLPNTIYWIYLATIYLTIMTWQDYKNKMWVDDRYNFLMVGVTLSLYSHFRHRFLYVLLVVVLCLFWYWFMRLFVKEIGEADVKALSWIMWGFLIISYVLAFWFLLVFLFTYLVYAGVKELILRYGRFHFLPIKSKTTPFFGVILLSFVTFCIIFGLYW